MKKRYDPLWEVVGEKVSLQGAQATQGVSCPRCRVVASVPADSVVGTVFCCGLCGATCQVIDSTGDCLIAEEFRAGG